MKMHTRFLVVILLSLLLGMGVCAHAETVTGTAGDLTWTVDSETATLTISGSGAMPDYRHLNPSSGPDYTTAPWYDHRTLFSQVIVESGVTSIGAHAFQNLSITSVSLPNTLLSIGDYALNSYSLKSVKIPESVTSVGDYVYANDTVVSGLMARGVSGATVWELRDGTLTVSGEIPDFGWTTPTGKYDISHLNTPWYSYYYDITSVVVSKGVTYIGANAFYDIYNLAKVTIPSTVTAIGKDAFGNCRYITYVNFSMEYDESASKWPLISFANANANPLAYSGTATLYANGSEVSYIVLQGDVTPYAFYNCQNTFGVAASGGKLTKVGDYAFYGCTNLYEASLPTSVSHIGNYAFYCCTNLKETYCLLDGATYVGDRAFYMCESLTEINMKRYANNEMTYLGAYAFSYCTAVTKVTLGNVSTIPSSCFQGSSMITEIVLPDGVTEIADRAFSSCSSLTSLTLPDTVQSIGEYAFSSCDSLTSLTLPESIQTIAAGLFYYNKGITSITIPASVQSIGNSAFSSCYNLTSVTIPASVQSIGNYAFAYNDRLSSVTFEGPAPTFASNAFSSTKTIIRYFPSSKWAVKILNYGGTLTWRPVGGSCGKATWQLTENGLLHITGSGAVAAGAWSAYADRITEILLGPTVTSVEAGAFAGLSNVTKVAIAGPVTQIAEDAFTGITAEVYWKQNDEALHAFVSSFAVPYEEGFGGTLDWRHPVCSVTSNTSTYYIRVTEHTISAVSSTEPTCTEDGAMGHWKCTCGLVFADNDPLTQTGAEAFAIAATGHTYDVSFIWEEDGSACQVVFTCQQGDAETTLDAAVTASQISEPDCLNSGETEYTAKVTFEETEYTDVTVLADIPALGHTEAVIPGLEPSCEEAGMMDYIFCEVCGEELQMAEEIPALGHTEAVMSEAYDPTCTEDGVTELICCSVCGTTLQASEIIPMLGHSPEADPGYEPDCLNPGLSDGSHCLTCGEVLLAQEVIPALGHTSVIDPGYAETDREDGLTEGSHCQTCGMILVEQQVIPARFTFDGDTVIAYNAADPDVVIPDGATALGMTLFKNNTAIRSVSIPDSVETLGTQAFFGCTGLEDVWLPDHLTSISAQTFYNVKARFHVSADSATAIALSYRNIAFTTEDGLSMRYRVTSSMGTPTAVWVAGYSGGASAVVIPETVCTYPVTQILANAFANQTQLTDITIPDSVTSIDDEAFTGVTGLTVYCNEASYAQTWATEKGYTVVLPVDPEDEYEYTIDENGHVTITKYVGAGGNVMIPTELGGGAVTTIGADAFRGNTTVTSVVIPEGVTSIANDVFYGCTGLTSATLPESLTSIGDGAFYNCNYLTSIVIPEKVTSIGMCAFQNCGSMTSVTFMGGGISVGSGAFKTCHTDEVHIPSLACWMNMEFKSGVYNIGNPLNNGGKLYVDGEPLVHIEIPDGVTSINEGAFYGYSNMLSVSIPDSVTEIGYGAFDGCTGLTSVTIPDSVMEIGSWAFINCTGLTSVTVPDGVTVIGDGTFAGCTGLTSVTIPDSVTEIGWQAFSSCTSLTSVTIPDSVTVIGMRAFYSCTGLTSVTIPDSVTEIGYGAFGGCTGLTSVTIPASVTTIRYDSFDTSVTICCYRNSAADVWAQENGNPIEYLEPEVITGTCGADLTWTLDDEGTLTITGTGRMDDYTADTEEDSSPWGTDVKRAVIESGVTYIGAWAFQECVNLTDVSIPYTVIEISSGVFSGCRSLTTVVLPESVNDIGSDAFEGCTSLTSINIPEGMTTISSNVFMRCTNLSSITLPDSVTTIMESAFKRCTSLTSVTIPASVTAIGDSAFDTAVTICCYQNSAADDWARSNGNPIEYLDEPNDEPDVPPYKYTITDGAVTITGGYTGYDEVLVIPDTLEGYPVVAIGEYAFNDCVNLPGIILPDSITAIGDYAFAYCESLSSITLPESLTSIGDSAFCGCASLTSIIIPESVTTIADCAFIECNSLISVTIPESVTSIGHSAFYGNADLVAQVKLGSYAYQWCVTNGISVQTDALIARLPASLTAIEAEAFLGSNVECVVIPDGCISIGAKAFAECSALLVVHLPDSATDIAEDAFDGCDELIFICDAESKAAAYAQTHGFTCLEP